MKLCREIVRECMILHSEEPLGMSRVLCVRERERERERRKERKEGRDGGRRERGSSIIFLENKKLSY